MATYEYENFSTDQKIYMDSFESQLEDANITKIFTIIKRDIQQENLYCIRFKPLYGITSLELWKDNSKKDIRIYFNGKISLVFF